MDFSYKFPSISRAGQLLPLTFIYTAKKHHAKKIGRKTEYIYLVYFRSNSLSLKKKEKSYIHFKSSASEQKVGEVHSLCKILVQEDSDWKHEKKLNTRIKICILKSIIEAEIAAFAQSCMLCESKKESEKGVNKTKAFSKKWI